MRRQSMALRLVWVTLAYIMIVIGLAACGNYHSSETKDRKFQTMQQGMAPQVPNQYNGRTAVYSVQIADQAAERVVMLDEVDQAYVLLYEGNAYVAVRLFNDSSRVQPPIQAKIYEQVKEVVPEADQVYITTNLKFVDLIYSYVHSANLGRTDQGMENRLKALLQRSFNAQHGAEE